MPKRSEKRDAAKAEYLARKGRGELVDLRELAEGLGVNYQTLRNWKSADEWEKAEPKKKRGGQPGSRNSAGHKNAAGSHKGAPAGNHNAEKDGAYSTIFFDTLSEAERELVMNTPVGSRAALEHEIQYKQDVPEREFYQAELKRCADEIASTELSLQTIRELIAERRNGHDADIISRR